MSSSFSRIKNLFTIKTTGKKISYPLLSETVSNSVDKEEKDTIGKAIESIQINEEQSGIDAKRLSWADCLIVFLVMAALAGFVVAIVYNPNILVFLGKLCIIVPL